MRVAVLTIDPAARIAIRLVAALLQSAHEVVTVIAPVAVPAPEDDADWAHLQHLARSRELLPPDPFLDPYPTVAAFTRNGVPCDRVADLRGAACAGLIRQSRADLLLLAAAPLLPRTVFAIPRFGTINYHAGVAPAYRGTATLHHALRNLDPAGVGYTFHLVDDGIDTGDILHREVVPLRAGDTVLAIHDRCERSARAALVRLVDSIESGGAVPRLSQQDAPGVTYRGIPTVREWRALEASMRSAEWMRLVSDEDKRR